MGRLTNIDVEMAILGGLLQFEDLADEISGFSESDFSFAESQKLYNIIKATFSAHNKVDIVLAGARLQEEKLLEFAGGCTGKILISSEFAHYKKEFLDLSKRRKLGNAANDIARLALNFDIEADEAVAKAESLLLSGETDTGSGTFLDLVVNEVKEIEKRKKGEVEIATPTGFLGYDKFNFGFRGSELIVIGAKTSVGKTALALEIGCNIAKNKPVIFFSLEMGRQQITQRIMSQQTNTPLSKIIKGAVNENDIKDLSQLFGKRINLTIDDNSGTSVDEIASKCRRLHRKNKLGAVVVDYLQLMQGKGETREREVANNSRALKRLAMELKCPVIALSQLNRSVDSRADKRPSISDLRESGAIEQDADIIWLLHRIIDPQKGDISKAEVNIAKCRNGKVYSFDLYYNAECVNYVEISRR